MTTVLPADARVFLFLQGPHGPFFKQLARQLETAGAKVWRVGFNAGDAAFWSPRHNYIPYTETPEHWPARFAQLLDERGVTDIVLYGDTRPIHAEAVAQARARGLHVHVFEEGYMRPYWVTYERDGSNGHSKLMQISIAEMDDLIERRKFDPPVPPGHWGDMRQHVYYGAAYHWHVLAMNRRYRGFRAHRSISVGAEFRLYVKRLLLMPLHALERRIATLRIRMGTFPYHLALLQLEHDSSFQMHGPFARQGDFLAHVIEGFAKGGPAHHHLVIKAHPLEDGRAPLRADIKRLASAHGLTGRIHFVRGGKLAQLLDHARSATTVNSTAAQQALWRGLPVRAFGRAVYGKPELVSDQPIADFFASPTRPDMSAYRHFRDFLLVTSQLPGSFYAQKGRRQLLRELPDKMLQAADPYALTPPQSAALQQQFHVVK
ncbi:MAG: capsular biosynthesis protein [Roseobacter sp.]|nr:capsular biosynthesis protein [Roseobacter sp.]